MRQEGINFSYDYRQVKPEELASDAKKLIEDCKAVYDAVAGVDPCKVTFENTILPLLEVDRDSYGRGIALQLPAMVALDKDLRDASSEAEKLLDEFSVEMAMRKDVFDSILAFSKTDEAMSLSPEHQRYLEKAVTDGKRNGLHLSEEAREEIKNVKKRISELGISFNKNLNEDTTFLMLEESELTGVPEDLVKSFEKDPETGKLKVRLWLVG